MSIYQCVWVWCVAAVKMGKRSNFVEIGRVVCINYGPDAGKLAVIIDIVNQSFALVDGANQTGVARGKLNFKHMAITPIKLTIGRSVKTVTLEKAFLAADVFAQFNATSWGKKLARQAKRANSSDFDRFQTMLLRKQVRSLCCARPCMCVCVCCVFCVRACCVNILCLCVGG